MIYLANEEVLKVRKTFKELLEELNDERFVVISRSCCVNVQYIKDIETFGIILQNGKKLFGTVHKIKEAKEKYLECGMSLTDSLSFI